jgi:hypothetical protein
LFSAPSSAAGHLDSRQTSPSTDSKSATQASTAPH